MQPTVKPPRSRSSWNAIGPPSTAARVWTRTPADAEDLLQETVLSGFRGAAGFRGDVFARTWLFRIARNAAFHQRHRAAQHRQQVSLESLGELAGWNAAGPEQLAARAHRRDLLLGALNGLEPEDREILTLRELEGLSGEETAEALGLSLAAMQSRLHRVRLRLIARLRQGGQS
jgi:RNA polymerase sigma-70 factor (ECF subfamily)